MPIKLFDSGNVISLPGEGAVNLDDESRNKKRRITSAPIVVHSLSTEEPEFASFLLEWGPDDGNDDNLTTVSIPGTKVIGDNEWVSVPYVLNRAVRGNWYRFRVSVINNFGWKSTTLPTAAGASRSGWIYQRAGADEDDLLRYDEVVNLLTNSDFEFDLLEDSSYELPYWDYWTGSEWATAVDGVGQIERGLFGRLTEYNLILKAGGKIRSDQVTIYPDRTYTLSGYLLQDAAGLGNITFRLAYYDSDDVLLDHDYILMGEDGTRVFDSAAWPGGSIFEDRDRFGATIYPPAAVSYGRVEVLNDGTSDIWIDDFMLSQTDRIVQYVSWDRESNEAYDHTWQYRRNIPPDGVIDFDAITPIEAFDNENGSVDIKLRWNWASGPRYASGFVMFGNLASSGVYSPTPTLADHDFAYKLANAEARKFDLIGVNPINRYSFAIAPYATVQDGIAYAALSAYDGGNNPVESPNNEDWIDFQSTTVVNLGNAPRTQINVTAASDVDITIEFIVTSSNVEPTTTYYRLDAEEATNFNVVPEIGDIPTLTIQRDVSDITVYYYSQGDTTGIKESVLEFIIDVNRIAELIGTSIEYDYSGNTYNVQWWADDDTDSVNYHINSGTVYIVSGQSGSTGVQGITPGDVDTVIMTPVGPSGSGTALTVYPSIPAPSASARLEMVPTTDGVQVSVLAQSYLGDNLSGYVEFKDPEEPFPSAGSISTTDKTLVVTGAAFTDVHVGYYVSVVGAGAGGSLLESRIDSVTDATTVELVEAASTTVSDNNVVVGGGWYSDFDYDSSDDHTETGVRNRPAFGTEASWLQLRAVAGGQTTEGQIVLINPRADAVLYSFNLFVVDDDGGSGDDQYTFSWVASDAVTDSYSIELIGTRQPDPVPRVEGTETSPATNSEKQLDAVGDADGNSDTHWGRARLKNPSGSVIQTLEDTVMSAT